MYEVQKVMPIFCDIVEAGERCPNVAAGKWEAASARDVVDAAFCIAHEGAAQDTLDARMNRHGMTIDDSRLTRHDFTKRIAYLGNVAPPQNGVFSWKTALTEDDIPKIAEKVAEILREKQYQELKGIFDHG